MRSTPWMRGWQFLLGAVIGLIPLVLWLLGYAHGANIICGTSSPGCYSVPADANEMATIALWLYLAALIAAFVLIKRPRWRFMGYGLMVLVCNDPVVAAFGCSIIAQSHH